MGRNVKKSPLSQLVSLPLFFLSRMPVSRRKSRMSSLAIRNRGAQVFSFVDLPGHGLKVVSCGHLQCISATFATWNCRRIGKTRSESKQQGVSITWNKRGLQKAPVPLLRENIAFDHVSAGLHLRTRCPQAKLSVSSISTLQKTCAG